MDTRVVSKWNVENKWEYYSPFVTILLEHKPLGKFLTLFYIWSVKSLIGAINYECNTVNTLTTTKTVIFSFRLTANFLLGCLLPKRTILLHTVQLLCNVCRFTHQHWKNVSWFIEHLQVNTRSPLPTPPRVDVRQVQFRARGTDKPETGPLASIGWKQDRACGAKRRA